MAKSARNSIQSPEVRNFLKDVKFLSDLPKVDKFENIHLEDYPFDHQLLTLSRLYRESRRLYLQIGGTYAPRVSSTMRSLSAQDLFADLIEFTPSAAELMWFKDHVHEVADPEAEMKALIRFNEISIFHEQNHRVIWRLLPPAPKEKRDLSRYLNFAESLVVTLDLVLGDELGGKVSDVFERLKIIYRPAGTVSWNKESNKAYRQYLLAILCATYYELEVIHPDDILKAVDYVLPGQKKMNKDAVRRGRQLSELFSRVTNPEWQERYWKLARTRLSKMHRQSKEQPLYLPEDPLDLEEELAIAHRVFDVYGL
jgi:hypothetical protein